MTSGAMPEAKDARGFAAEPVDGLSFDPAWPRTGGWAPPRIPRAAARAGGARDAGGGGEGERIDLVLVGVPASQTSLSPTSAHLTPAAVRGALRRYSSHLVAPGARGRRGDELELVLDEALAIRDAGDLVDPDSAEGEAAAKRAVGALAAAAELVVALGGDNSITVPVALGVSGERLADAGLVTFDAHHDLRDGRSNGSPVRRLVEAGLEPTRIVQIGIADFANSRAYRDRAKRLGITVIHREELFERTMPDVIDEALEIAGAGGGPIHVDLDVDVCDRAVAPACPASLPGGIQAHELRRATRLLAADPRVRGIDFAEVDAAADTADGRTVRLVALCVLEAAAGLAVRLRRAM